MNKSHQNQPKEKTSRTFPPVFFLLPLIHILVAVPLAYYFNIWSDEASTLYTTGDGLFSAVTRAGYEKQAPLYFIVLSEWRLLDDSVFFARIFSVICSVLSISAFFVFVRRLWDEKTALFAAFFFSIHPYLFWVSFEVRVYALVVLLTLLLLVLFERAYLAEEEKGARMRIFFTVFAIVSLYTNYYIGFVLVGFFAALLVLKRFEAARSYFAHMAAAGLFFLPSLGFTLYHFGENPEGYLETKSVVESLRVIWNHTLSFVLPTEIFPAGDQTAISLVRVWFARILFPVTFLLLILRRKMPDSKVILFASINAVILGFLVCAYFLLGKLYVELRHAAVLFPPLLLLLLALIIELSPRTEKRKGYFAVIAIILTISYSYAFTMIYPGFVKRGDWTRVAQFVEEHEKSNQPVVVFRSYEVLAFIESYNGKNKVLPNDKLFDWNYEGEFGSAGMYTKQIEYVISVIPKDAPEIWLITEENCQITTACGALEKFAKENYTVAEDKFFFKERLRLLRKK